MAKEKFEEALNKLEKIVSKLEKGDIPLEESLKFFEEGIRLSRLCNQKLDEAERRVEILLKDKDGALKPQPFDPSVNSGQAPSINPVEVPLSISGQGLSDHSGRNDSTLPEDSPVNDNE
jgi:exodeoxyribonuclease VII small subunit